MAVPIQILTTPVSKFVLPTSRYNSCQVMLWSEKGVLTLTTYKRTPITEQPDDMFRVLSKGEEYRPDKTSFAAYDTVDFWWRIMEANNIKDIFDYKAGLNIRIPSRTSLL